MAFRGDTEGAVAAAQREEGQLHSGNCPVIGQSRCVDARLADRIAREKGLNVFMSLAKDLRQRKDCECTRSTDIGQYTLQCPPCGRMGGCRWFDGLRRVLRRGLDAPRGGFKPRKGRRKAAGRRMQLAELHGTAFNGTQAENRPAPWMNGSSQTSSSGSKGWPRAMGRRGASTGTTMASLAGRSSCMSSGRSCPTSRSYFTYTGI